jgi:hypothetical protein
MPTSPRPAPKPHTVKEETKERKLREKKRIFDRVVSDKGERSVTFRFYYTNAARRSAKSSQLYIYIFSFKKYRKFEKEKMTGQLKLYGREKNSGKKKRA